MCNCPQTLVWGKRPNTNRYCWQDSRREGLACLQFERGLFRLICCPGDASPEVISNSPMKEECSPIFGSHFSRVAQVPSGYQEADGIVPVILVLVTVKGMRAESCASSGTNCPERLLLQIPSSITLLCVSQPMKRQVHGLSRLVSQLRSLLSGSTKLFLNASKACISGLLPAPYTKGMRVSVNIIHKVAAIVKFPYVKSENI